MDKADKSQTDKATEKVKSVKATEKAKVKSVKATEKVKVKSVKVTEKTKRRKSLAKDKNEMSYDWYATQLGMSLRTAKRKGKSLLMNLFAEKERDIQEQIPCLLEKALKKAEQKLVKTLDSNFFFDLDEDKVNEETRKIGIDLLNKTLKSLSAMVDQDTQMTVHQRSYMLIGISKMILGVR